MDLIPSPRALLCLYGLTRRHKLSTRTPERFPQHVERGYRRPSTLPLSSCGQQIPACISDQGLPRPSSTLPPLLSPSLYVSGVL
ncbi:hypothetical protein DPMN_023409 [Dreissena polymorpha]|uniref:Uncharacterized protein n=1 Tax=Dreissena polymorpha TaxID=45954 RepID=A0A9D4LMV6_DREPO|nr:hypothetical protein DPMN_023409 [Dreissena polymorpha]